MMIRMKLYYNGENTYKGFNQIVWALVEAKSLLFISLFLSWIKRRERKHRSRFVNRVWIHSKLSFSWRRNKEREEKNIAHKRSRQLILQIEMKRSKEKNRSSSWTKEQSPMVGSVAVVIRCGFLSLKNVVDDNLRINSSLAHRTVRLGWSFVQSNARDVAFLELGSRLSTNLDWVLRERKKRLVRKIAFSARYELYQWQYGRRARFSATIMTRCVDYVHCVHRAMQEDLEERRNNSRLLEHLIDEEIQLHTGRCSKSLPSMSTKTISRMIVMVVIRTSMEKAKVQMGSANLYSG